MIRIKKRFQEMASLKDTAKRGPFTDKEVELLGQLIDGYVFNQEQLYSARLKFLCSIAVDVYIGSTSPEQDEALIDRAYITQSDERRFVTAAIKALRGLQPLDYLPQ